MADPVTHAWTFSKTVAAIAAAVSVAFDLPFGVFVAGFAGVFLAVSVNDAAIPDDAPIGLQVRCFLRGVGVIAAGTLLAAILTPGFRDLVQMLTEFSLNETILKPVALAFGFFPWHTASRIWIVEQIKTWGRRKAGGEA